MGVWLLFMVVQLVRSVVDFVRSFGDRRHLDRVLAHHWTVRLLHAVDPDQIGELVDMARRATGGAVLLVECRRISTAGADEKLHELPIAHVLPDVSASRALVLGPRARLTDPRTRRVSMVPGFVLLAMAVVAGVVVSAIIIADAERAACTSTCVDRPSTLPNAVYWLISRLLPFDPGWHQRENLGKPNAGSLLDAVRPGRPWCRHKSAFPERTQPQRVGRYRSCRSVQR
jgi:hypothetical protein